MLEVDAIGKRFGGLTVLSAISFSVAAGSVVGLIGPNGAGKTTLFNILTGFIRPDRGRVRLDGTDITGVAPERLVGRGIARTFQLVRPFARLSVLENVMVAAFARTRHAAEAETVARACIARVELAGDVTRRADTLTVSDRKRVELARALATGPRLLLLDEVMCGLNPTEMSDMVAIIRRLRDKGLTVLLVEHVMDVISELADDVVVLNEGNVLAQGAGPVVLNDPRVLAAYLGDPGAAH